MMAVFAIGLVTSSVMLVDSHAIVPRKADIAPEQVVGDRDAVPVPESILTSVNGVFNLYGRSLNIGPPVTLVADTGVAALRPEWLARLRTAFTSGLDARKDWWPHLAQTDAARRRAFDVNNIELVNWWRTGSQILAGIITGRDYVTMTAEQIEVCLAHYERIAATGMGTWYRLGTGLNLDDPPNPALPTGQQRIMFPVPNFGGGGARPATQYANSTLVLTAAGTAYTDKFSLAAGVLTPRDPDYGWVAVPITLVAGTTYDPENPA